MDCDNVQDAILESLIESHDADTRAMIEAHIAECRSCTAFVERQLALDRQLGATLVPPMLSDGFRASVRARLSHDARTFWSDLLPDVIHFASCAVVTVVGLVWLPLSIPIVLAGGAAGTILTHMLLTAAHESLDAAEEIAS